MNLSSTKRSCQIEGVLAVNAGRDGAYLVVREETASADLLGMAVSTARFCMASFRSVRLPNVTATTPEGRLSREDVCAFSMIEDQCRC